MPDGSLIFDTKIDQTGFEQDAGNLKGLATKVTTAIGLTLSAGAIAKGLVSLGKTAVTQGSNFEASMSQVAATMGTTVDQIQDLSDVAKDMGSKTKFSATEAANALNYLALAGMDADEQIGALPTVLNLAAAGNMDLAYASDLVTDSMSALGLSIDDMEGFADQMARTSSKSNTSVAQLGEAILVVGGQARLAGMNTVELNTALGILADNGIKGSEGGTALRNMLKNLYTPTAAAKRQFDDLGISVSNSDGSLKDIQTVLQELGAALDGLGEDERMNVMSNIFDTRTIAAANALLENSGERFTELSATITDSLGAASAMASTQIDNLKGDITLAQSALEGLSVTAYGAFSGKLRSGVQSFTSTISGLTDALGKGGLQGAVDFITDKYPLATAAVTGLVTAYAGMSIVKTATALVQAYQIAQVQVNLASMEGSLVTAAETGALTAKEIIVAALTGKLTLAQAAQALLNKTVLANPYVAAAAAIGAVVAGLVLLHKHVVNTNPELKALRDNTNAVKNANKELADTMASSAESYAKTTKEIEEQALYADSAYQKLAQLSRQYKGTEAEQRVMKQLCSELNSTVDGLNIGFDEQTGALNVAADAMEAYINKMKQQAMVQANMERYTQLLREQSDAQYNLYLAQQNLNDAQEKFEQGLITGWGLMKAEREYKNATDAANEAALAVENHEGYMESFAATVDETAGEVEEYDEALEGAAEAEEAVIIAGVDVRELLEQIGMSAEDAAQRFETYADAATDMFNRINTESELSTKDMIANLDFNAQAIEQYGQNLARLAEILPEDLYTALAGDPAEMAGVVAELASATDEELAALATSYGNAGDAAREAWLASMGVPIPNDQLPTTQAAEAIAADTSLSTALTTAANDAYTDFDLAIGTAGFDRIGQQICDKVVEGTTDLPVKLDNIGRQSISSMASAINNGYSDLYRAGSYAMQGLINGIESKRQAVINELQSVINDASATVTLNLEIRSPSRKFFRFGEYTMDGYINAIKAKLGEVRKVMRTFADTVQDSAYPAATATLQEQPGLDRDAPVSRTTNVTQNIYAEKQSPAEMLREAIWQQERAALMGV